MGAGRTPETIDFSIKPLPVFGDFNRQRFNQFSPEDTANFYIITGKNTKRPFAMYPAFGRRHIRFGGYNELIFPFEPRGIFKSIDYWYSVVGNIIYRIDRNYNKVIINSSTPLHTISGNVYFDFLVVNTMIFSCFVDGQKIYVYQEDNGQFDIVTDVNAPGNSTIDGKVTKPGFIAAFGNRITVSIANSSQFFLSVINLQTQTSTAGVTAFDPLHCFTIGYNPLTSQPGAAVFAQEDSIIRQMGVISNTLYIFCDYVTGIWSNIPSTFSGTGVSFPWKKSTAYNWNFGIADPLSLSIGFDRITFLAQNKDGLLQVMTTEDGRLTRISSKAIDTLFQHYADDEDQENPFLEGSTNGFIYEYENTIFYRLSAGKYDDDQVLDQEQKGNCIEYNFETKEWHRCIELNGQRNRVQKHIFFNNKHLVTVLNDSTVYQLSGAFYTNEITNPNTTDKQAENYYFQDAMRYERILPIISEEDYAEFETEYVEIDFVWGMSNINRSTSPFQNTQFIIDEKARNNEPVYLIAEGTGEAVFLVTDEGNTPGPNDLTYNDLFKPHIELYFSDDGGVSFFQADVLEFSQMGVYQWRMRWYQLGCSRNRVYKLICVSPVPIVILGGVMSTRRSSGGAN